jgi:hypothetical protein
MYQTVGNSECREYREYPTNERQVTKWTLSSPSGEDKIPVECRACRTVWLYMTSQQSVSNRLSSPSGEDKVEKRNMLASAHALDAKVLTRAVTRRHAET